MQKRAINDTKFGIFMMLGPDQFIKARYFPGFFLYLEQ